MAPDPTLEPFAAVPLVIVVAVADNGVIGAKGDLPWHLPEDLRQVKKLTMGKPLIMGRRTYQSIGRPLPGRATIVLTSDPEFSVPGVTVARDFEAALQAADRAALVMGADEIIAFGGAGIYQSALPLTQRIYKTEVHISPDGDTRFPDLDPDEWREVGRDDHRRPEANGLSYGFVVLDRVTRPARAAADGSDSVPEIRAMTAEDGDAVLEIYRQGIETGHATFEAAPPSEWAPWFASRLTAGRQIAMVDGKIAGWSALSAVSARSVYAGVAEVSVYVADGMQGRGVGRVLLAALVEASEAAGIWTLQASIFPENEASVRLHERFGFRLMGTREKIAWMRHGPMAGQWRDTVILERRSILVGVAPPA